MEETPRGRKNRKGKGRADGDSTPAGGKRKRGAKAASVTPSIQEDDEEERDTVSTPSSLHFGQGTGLIVGVETSQDQGAGCRSSCPGQDEEGL